MDEEAALEDDLEIGEDQVRQEVGETYHACFRRRWMRGGMDKEASVADHFKGGEDQMRRDSSQANHIDGIGGDGLNDVHSYIESD